MLDFFIPKTPPSTNGVYRYFTRGKFTSMYLSKEGKDYKRLVQLHVQNKGLITVPLKLEINFYFGDKRKRDIDNYNKLLLDALNKHLYEDDSQITELLLKKHYNKERPGVHLLVSLG